MPPARGPSAPDAPGDGDALDRVSDILEYVRDVADLSQRIVDVRAEHCLEALLWLVDARGARGRAVAVSATCRRHGRG
jgi:hypothetical protein